MTLVGDLDFGNVLVCEDVRQEKNEKFILIGIFPGDILLSEVPLQVPLTFYAEFAHRKAGEYAVSLRISGPGEATATLRANVATPPEEGTSTLVGPKMEILMAEEGTLTLDASVDGETWATLISKKVRLRDPIASAQLSEQSQTVSQGS